MSRCICGKSRGAEQVGCRSCWFSLPKPLRDLVWKLYRREQGSEKHRAAVFACIKWLHLTRDIRALADRALDVSLNNYVRSRLEARMEPLRARRDAVLKEALA